MRPSALLLLLFGCASTVEWEKPGASRQEMDADARACSSMVQARPMPARSRDVDFVAIGGGVPGAPRGATVVPQTNMERDADRQLNEAQRMEACMRQKGYRLRAD